MNKFFFPKKPRLLLSFLKYTVLSFCIATQLVLADQDFYRVKEKDTLSDIVYEIFGSPLYSKSGYLAQIIKLNPNINPNIIVPNQIIKLCTACLPKKSEDNVIAASPAYIPPRTIVQAVAEPKVETKTLESISPFAARIQLGRDRVPASTELTQGFYIQPGIGYLSSSYSANQKSSNLIGRVEAGYFYSNLETNLFYRRSLSKLSTENVASPEWYDLNFGYALQLPSSGSVKPIFVLLAGMEFYKNSITTTERFKYLSNIANFSLGFKSRFTFQKRWDLGGTFMAGVLFTSTRHLYLLGDLSYWFTPKLRAGLGYWLDYYEKRTTDDHVFENSTGFETLVRYYF